MSPTVTPSAFTDPRLPSGERDREAVQAIDSRRLVAALRSILYSDHPDAPPAKAIADDCGVGYGYLRRAADPEQPDMQLQARLVAPITHASKNDALITELAEQCGGVFYRLTPGGSIDADTARTLKEFAEFLSAVADARVDQTVTLEEFLRVHTQAHEGIAATLALVEKLRMAAGLPEFAR